jgi:hypothetical protein
MISTSRHRSRGWKGALIVASLLLIARAPSASATLLVSVDMDPITPGIQSSLSVMTGNPFAIDVVVTGDGQTVFDTAIFQVNFNNAGPVTSQTGPITAGSLAALTPFVIDVFGGIPVVPGDPLTTNPSPPDPGYASASGLAGLLSLTGPFPLGFEQEESLYGLTMSALAKGTSTISISTGGNLGGIALAGVPIPFSVASGTLTVTGPIGPTVAEPSVLMLFGLGLLGLRMSRRKAKQKG